MKQCREYKCPLQDICRGAVDNETWWNISDNCEIFSFVKAQADKIYDLENRLKECENGYEGTLHLESCKLHDAEEKVRELTEENERLREENENADVLVQSYYDKVVAVNKINTELEITCAKLRVEEKQSQSLIKTLHDKLDEGYAKFVDEERAEAVREMQERFKANLHNTAMEVFGHNRYYLIGEQFIDQIAKELLEGEK